MKTIFSILTVTFLASCTSTVERKNPIGETFPQVTGNSLDGKSWTFPDDISGQKSLLLIGYKHKSQFDIDRWLIGIDQVGYKINVFEVPTVSPWIPDFFSDRIDQGMREGIPEELWRLVVTIYDDADKIIDFLGNENGKNARAVVLDETGKVVFLHDRGFSVNALNQLAPYFPKKSLSQN